MTGGRTGEDAPPIALEGLIAATPEGLQTKHQYRWEAERLVELAGSGTALIELAALMDVPIGVVRVLVADLAKRGSVIVVDSPGGAASDLDGIAYANLLKKVLDGIRSL
jgi:uncharacterized protein (UPF0261 family)